MNSNNTGYDTIRQIIPENSLPYPEIGQTLDKCWNSFMVKKSCSFQWSLESECEWVTSLSERRGEVLIRGSVELPLNRWATGSLLTKWERCSEARSHSAPAARPTAYITFTINNFLSWYKTLSLCSRVCVCVSRAPYVHTHNSMSDRSC